MSQTISAKPEKKVSEKEDLRTKAIMDELFKEIDGGNAEPAGAFSSENKKILQESANLVENMANLDDELDMLEAQMEPDAAPIKGTMDIEKPAPKLISQQKPAMALSNISNSGLDSFIRTLYTRQKERDKERAFTLHKSDNRDLELDSNNYELDVVDNKAHFYYIDIQEDFTNKSRLLLFGKVKVKGKPPVSCCVAVHGMERRYYFFKKENDNVTIEQTQEEVMKKIEKRHPRFYKNVKSEIVTDKYYCFELDIARGNVSVVQVTYPFSDPPLDLDFEGVYYNGMIGGTYKPQELFVIDNKIMGPCWLEIEDFKLQETKSHSHCQLELSVEFPEDVSVLKGMHEIPKFSAISLSLIRDKDKDKEIKAIVGLYTTNYDVENVQSTISTTPHVFVSLSGADNKKGSDGIIMESLRYKAKEAFGSEVNFFPREFALMQGFIQKLNRLDPDLIIGHDINNVFYEIIISKIEQYGLANASSLSRSKRDSTEMKRALKGHGLRRIRGLNYGRMVCDTHLSSLEIIRETNYELDFLAEKHLKENNIYAFRRALADPVLNLLATVDEAIMNAHLSLKLCQKLQLVQLNKQLTNVSGCFWYQSFQNLRAERNEMLLMHTFSKSGFIFPDKFEKRFEEGAKRGKKREKAKYEGGKVLDPKSGLYQDFILLLDFNSLYPSIIQEYKICFTTVRRAYVTIDFYNPSLKREIDRETIEDAVGDDEDVDQDELLERTKIPDHDHNSIKDSDPHLQILPRIIKLLVTRRKEVKTQIKNASDPKVKETLGIKQNALKLIANSIYGCLGFKNSRFYAQQLAALITYYGRNILQGSADKVNEMGYEVVYGDTDSLMINSREKTLGEALKKGIEIKRNINSQYRSRGIMEIEVDGVFRTLLLLKKKKYAADKLENLDEILKDFDESRAKYKIEVKGLDIVRRDWSGITKSSGEYLVNLILSQSDSDTIREEIYNYLNRLRQDLDNNKISIEQFTIFKQLNKNPNQYNDKGHPHVMVAKKMLNRGYTIEQVVNHFIPYIICVGENASVNFAERSYHPDEVRQQKLRPDVKWYADHQLCNPFARILEYFPGIEMDRVSDILGIDKRKMHQSMEYKEEVTNYNTDDGNSVLFHPDETIGSMLYWKCSRCGQNNNAIKAETTKLVCSNNKCEAFISEISLKNTVSTNIRRFIQDYNKALFSLERREDKGIGNKGLPIQTMEVSPEQEAAVADLVSRTNTKIFNLETLFTVKRTTNLDYHLVDIYNMCKEQAQDIREQSAFENIQFGDLCARAHEDKTSCRHYSIIKKAKMASQLKTSS